MPLALQFTRYHPVLSLHLPTSGMNQLTFLIWKLTTPCLNPWFIQLVSAETLPWIISLGQWEFTEAHHSLMLRMALIMNPDSSESILLDAFALPISKHVLGQLLHHEDHLPNHEEHDS